MKPYRTPDVVKVDVWILDQFGGALGHNEVTLARVGPRELCATCNIAVEVAGRITHYAIAAGGFLVIEAAIDGGDVRIGDTFTLHSLRLQECPDGDSTTSVRRLDG